VSTDLPGRYQVALAAHGRTLTDETTGRLLTEWPDGG
jgi:hypothetical protein